MSERAEFTCPRCMERNYISEDALLHDREITFECANCGRVVTVHNDVPDAMDKLIRSIKGEIGKAEE